MTTAAIDRCNAEIELCRATEGHPAWLIAFGELDWLAEIRMIEKEAVNVS